jgi:hypothetical protein
VKSRAPGGPWRLFRPVSGNEPTGSRAGRGYPYGYPVAAVRLRRRVVAIVAEPTTRVPS